MVVTFDKRYHLALLRDLVVFTKAWSLAFLSKLVWILDVVCRSLVGFTVSESTVLNGSMPMTLYNGTSPYLG